MDIAGVVVEAVHVRQVVGILLANELLLGVLCGSDLGCLGEGTAVDVLLSGLTVVDDGAEDIGDFVTKSALSTLLGRLAGASGEFLVAQQTVNSTELDLGRITGSLSFSGVLLELLLGGIALVNDGIDRLDGLLSVFSMLLGEESEVDLVVLVEELVRAVRSDVELLRQFVVELGLAVLARFELNVDAATVKLSEVLSAHQERIDVEAALGLSGLLEATGLDHVDLVDAIFSLDVALASSLLRIDGRSLDLGFLQVLEAERHILRELDTLFLQDLCGVVLILVALLDREVAHATKAILLLDLRILGSEGARLEGMLIELLIKFIVHKLDQFSVESAGLRVLSGHDAAYCQYTGEPHYYKLKN